MTSRRTRARRRQLRESVDPVAGDELAAGRTRAPRRAPSATAAAPPRTIGQPTAWAYVPEHQPERGARAGGRAASIECAEIPAKRARAARRREPVAGQAARRPQRRQAEARQRQRMARHDGRPAGGAPGELARRRGRAGRTAAATRGRPAPRAARRGRHRPLEHDRPAAVERVGDRGVRVDRARRRARRGRSSGRTARRRVSGRIVEHMSWRKPGRVSSIVRVPPPASSAAS